MSNINTVSIGIRVIRILVGVCSVIFGIKTVFLWLGLIFNYASYMLGYNMGSGKVFPMIFIFLGAGIGTIVTNRSPGIGPGVCSAVYLAGFLLEAFLSLDSYYKEAQGLVFLCGVVSLAMALILCLTIAGTWKIRLIMAAVAVVLVGTNYYLMKHSKSVYEEKERQWKEEREAEIQRENEEYLKNRTPKKKAEDHLKDDGFFSKKELIEILVNEDGLDQDTAREGVDNLQIDWKKVAVWASVAPDFISQDNLQEYLSARGFPNYVIDIVQRDYDEELRKKYREVYLKVEDYQFWFLSDYWELLKLPPEKIQCRLVSARFDSKKEFLDYCENDLEIDRKTAENLLDSQQVDWKKMAMWRSVICSYDTDQELKELLLGFGFTEDEADYVLQNPELRKEYEKYMHKRGVSDDKRFLHYGLSPSRRAQAELNEHVFPSKRELVRILEVEDALQRDMAEQAADSLQTDWNQVAVWATVAPDYIAGENIGEFLTDRGFAEEEISFVLQNITEEQRQKYREHYENIDPSRPAYEQCISYIPD